MAENVEYHESDFAEFRGNPLIEGLPPLRSDAEILKSYYRFPTHDDSERQKPSIYRKICTDRIDRLVLPRPEYLDLHRSIESQVWRGYEVKNPFSPTTNSWLHYANPDEPGIYPKTGAFKPCGRATTIFGSSGAGKTTMIEAVLRGFPQFLRHTNYQGDSPSLDQLVYLYVECPSSASISGLCHSIFDAMDTAMGTTYKREFGRLTITRMQDAVDQLVRSNFIGLIAIDELQSISAQKAGGKKAFLKFLLRLMNIAGVPFLLSGTDELEKILADEQWTARRCEEGGIIRLSGLDSTLWDIFLPQLWQLQWTNVETPLTSSLSKELRNLSKGIPSYAVRTYREAQKYVIGTGDERITTGVLRAVHNSTSPMSAAHLAAVSIDDGRKPVEAPVAKKNTPEKVAEKPTTIPDIDRIQHPEFQEAIVASLSRGIIVTGEDRLVRDALRGGSVLDSLETSGLIASDLLGVGKFADVT